MRRLLFLATALLLIACTQEAVPMRYKVVKDKVRSVKGVTLISRDGWICNGSVWAVGADAAKRIEATAINETFGCQWEEQIPDRLPAEAVK